MNQSAAIPDSLLAGARTVEGIATHFEQLKASAGELLQRGSASERGFFTPSEDEEVRHLLVSYWQSRNALIELVISLHRHEGPDGTPLDGHDRPAAFLIAWAGALALVDAARYLRANCEDRPVVRQKLNEPEPHFGIPEGTYDRVQASLTSPVHVWHLYHAREYWQQHQDELRAHAKNAGLESIVDWIDRLQQQTEVDVQHYATSRLTVRTRQLKQAGRDLLSRALYGLQKAVSRLIADQFVQPGHVPGLPESVANEIRHLLRPGDVLINRKEHALTNYFLPGYWPHAAFYIGRLDELKSMGLDQHPEGQPRWKRLHDCGERGDGRVVEAQKDGVWIRSLASPFYADAITVIRPQMHTSIVAEAISRGLFHDGKPYDFDFDFTRSDRLVCTEVVYRSCEGLGDMSFPLTRRAGRLTLAAEDLLRMALAGKQFQVAACFVPDRQATLATDQQAESLLRQTLEV